MIEIDSKKLACVIARTLDEKLGKDITILNISNVSSLADYFVIVTGTSIQHTKALANEIEMKIEKEGYEIYANEGFRDASWILVDLGDIIVHIFTEEQREFYDLEKLWD